MAAPVVLPSHGQCQGHAWRHSLQSRQEPGWSEASGLGPLLTRRRTWAVPPLSASLGGPSSPVKLWRNEWLPAWVCHSGGLAGRGQFSQDCFVLWGRVIFCTKKSFCSSRGEKPLGRAQECGGSRGQGAGGSSQMEPPRGS